MPGRDCRVPNTECILFPQRALRKAISGERFNLGPVAVSLEDIILRVLLAVYSAIKLIHHAHVLVSLWLCG